jgi:predicted DNA-binding transcriptional regulator AlpA
MKFSRTKTVAERYDVHPRTIVRWALDPTYSARGFPKPVKLGDNTVGYSNDELDAYDERLVEFRDVAQAKIEAEK